MFGEMKVKDEEFVKSMLRRASDGELPVEGGYAGPDTKQWHYFAIRDPESGRVVIGTGDTSGNDYSWGFEIEPAAASRYL